MQLLSMQLLQNNEDNPENTVIDFYAGKNLSFNPYQTMEYQTGKN